MSLLQETLERIGPLDQAAMDEARARQSDLTKPAGSLGRLESLSVQIAGITGLLTPRTDRKAVVVMAGDHGVTGEGVSAYPSEVTPQMVLNFLNGGAAINVLARLAGARVTVVDIGVAVELAPRPGLRIAKVARGTGNIARGPAMTREEAARSVEVGIEAVEAELDHGLDLLATGDMGIGNTTPSSAIAAVMTGRRVADVTGRGTGLDDRGLTLKVEVIERAIAFNRPDRTDALDVLAKVGGLEIGGIAGLILGAAARRVPVIVDGFISGAGALIAAGLSPAVRDYMIPAHRSVEIGHRAILDHLGVQAILDLDMRLGEGTGAALAMNVVEAAVRILGEMATFSSAGVSTSKE